ERGRLLKERVQASESIFKLRYEAYKAGKETLSFLMDANRDRLEAKLELAGHNKSETRLALQEALDDARMLEQIAIAKYKAGSGTQLDYTTAQSARLGYELRLAKQ